MSRSSRITGIFASLASFSTASQPVDTTGARKIASTPWATKERIALIWFSCFCCASAIFRLTVRLLASDLETVVSAARHPDSDPICEKPTVSWAAITGGATSAVVKARPSKIVFKAMRRFLLSGSGARFGIWTPFPANCRLSRTVSHPD